MIKHISNDFNFEKYSNESRVKLLYKNHKGIIKTANDEEIYCDEIRDYIKNKLKSEPNKSKFHVLFLGAGEYYSCNRNGDWFGEDDLIKTHKTFEEYGYVYRNHVNKDPKKKYGDIEFVVYNHRMHRVEGIIALDNDKCEDVLAKYEKGKNIPVSMAAKLKYDICSICGHKSKSLSEYCSHLKYEMCHIYPDGRKVYAINPDPLFFDISIVIKPADPTAYFFKKVAYMRGGKEIRGIKKKASMDKIALVKKLAELEKHIDGVVNGEIEDGFIKPFLNTISTPLNFPASTLEALKEYPFEDIIRASIDEGVLLSPHDFGILLDDIPIEPYCVLRPFNLLLAEVFKDILGLDFISAKPRWGIILKELFRDIALNNIDNLLQGGTKLVIEQPPHIRIFTGPDSFGFSSSSGKIIIKKSSLEKKKRALLYNSYKADFLRKNFNKKAILYTVLSNFIR